MDISATELLKALRRFLVNRDLPVGGAPRAGVSSTVLLVALSLSVAGCKSFQPGTTGRTAPPPQAETRGAEQLASATKPPDGPLRPAQPVRAHAPRLSEAKPPTKPPTKLPPATASKRAERLLALNPPLTVRARERTTLPAEPSAPKASTGEIAGTVTGAPVEELVFHGSPSKARPPQRTVMKALGWLGLVVGGGVLAALVRLYLIRRGELLQLHVGDDALKMPRELGFKEPIGAQEP